MSFRENEKHLRYMEYCQRETGTRHHTALEESYPYKLLQAGDIRAGEESRKVFEAGLTGHISNNPLRNVKYLFVAGSTLANRAAMSAGLERERSNNISDMYIMRMDLLNSISEVLDLFVEMMEYYAMEVAALEKRKAFSQAVVQGMDYIYEHLHQSITVSDVAAHLGLSRSYFSTLFKKETEQSVSAYVTGKRIETAKNMLLYSDIPYAEIAATLAFQSQSHFISVFKRNVGVTPGQYRRGKR